MLRGAHRIKGFYVNWASIAEFSKGYGSGSLGIFLFDRNTPGPRVRNLPGTITLTWRACRRHIFLLSARSVVLSHCQCLGRRTLGSGGRRRLRLVGGWRNVPRIHRKQFGVLLGPFRRQSIQRALGVVLLIRNHPSDSNDQVVQTFRGRPEIANTNRRIIEIGMEHLRQHPALRRPSRVAERKIHFQVMNVALLNISGRRNKQSFDVVFEPVHFRRHSRCSGNFDQRPAGKFLRHLVVVEFQSSDTRRKHGPGSNLLKKSSAPNLAPLQTATQTPTPLSSSTAEPAASPCDSRAPPSNTFSQNTRAALATAASPPH